MDTFHFYPIGSMFTRPESDSVGYVDLLGNFPDNVKNMVISPNTPKYIIGLGKSYKIPEEQQANISFAILRVALGKLRMSELSTTLSKELNIDIDSALKMASEIDQDLFAPIQGELDAFWAGQKTEQGARVTPPYEGGARGGYANTTNPLQHPLRKGESTTTAPNPSRTQNVLNLKELNARPELKDLPAPEVPRKIVAGSRIVDLKNRETQSPPSPYQGEGRGEVEQVRPATPAPLAPLRQGYAGQENREVNTAPASSTPSSSPLVRGRDSTTVPTPSPVPPRTFPLPPSPRQ